MKRMTKIFGLLAMFALVLSACGGDDKTEDPYEVKSNEFTKIYEVPIRGYAPQMQTVKTAFTLKDLLSTQSIPEANFISAEFQRGQCYINFDGLKNVSETVALNDFIIKLGARADTKIGVVNTTGVNGLKSDYVHSSDQYTNISKMIFEDIVSSARKSESTVSFIPSEDVLQDKNVVLKIKVTALVKYKVYKVTPVAQ
ncbi:MAG: hypothetical protein RL662_1815 [Bacteroidota bacterium]|jgi:hypothetical protein